VLLDMRMRLRRSERPNRIFEIVLEVAKAAGLIGRKRVLDSTALYDAVATQDTVTLIRSAIRALLRVAPEELESKLRASLVRDDDYRTPGKPTCDWNDAAAREALIVALASDGFAALAVLDDLTLGPEVHRAGELLATVLGQDLEQTSEGRFRIARRVAPDRVISTVDPEARHGHKTSARGFDGYKGHVAVDPNSELVTATCVTPGNAGDAEMAEALLPDLMPGSGSAPEAQESLDDASAAPGADGVTGEESEPAEVYGDAAYGSADFVSRLEKNDIGVFTKVAPSPSPQGGFPQSAFDIALEARTARCPAGVVIPLKPRGKALFGRFGAACATCTLRASCTKSKRGRVLNVHPKYATLKRQREKQRAPKWQTKYRQTRPKVERKIADLMRRRHGGRRARVRGVARVAADFALLGGWCQTHSTSPGTTIRARSPRSSALQVRESTCSASRLAPGPASSRWLGPGFNTSLLAAAVNLKRLATLGAVCPKNAKNG
jgi:hypothetical protein